MSANNLSLSEEETVSIQETARSKRHKATKDFLDRVNSLRSSNKDTASSPLQWNDAVKFLMARKFDVHRALQLYEQHEQTRQKEGLKNFDISVEPLKTELTTGKFTILRCRDVSGAAVALFSAKLHDPKQSSHQSTLQALVCQLDAALQSSDTQRHGIIFIYDMSDSLYQNFDYQLSQKILTLLKGAYPARLKKVLIVTAPLWFKAPFKVLRLFVREKLRDRVYTVTLSELAHHIPKECLPNYLGGTLVVNHALWLQTCIPALTQTTDCMNNTALSSKNMDQGSDETKENELKPEETNGRPTATSAHDLINGGDVTSPEFSSDEEDNSSECESSDLHDAEDDLQTTDMRAEKTSLISETTDSEVMGNTETKREVVNSVQTNGESIRSAGESTLCSVEQASLEESLHTSTCDGFTLDQFVEHLKHKARLGLHTDYMQIKNTPPVGTFENSRRRCNQLKNRYTDVLCLDHSRVVLADPTEEKQNDYINANFVDGYNQKNAFISTQGPLPHTSPDFWRLVWEQRVVVVVMTTRVVERGRTKCGQYWPETEGNVMRFPLHSVSCVSISSESDFITTILKITDTISGESRLLSHFQFSSWPDYGVPESALAMLNFLETVRVTQASRTSDLGTNWKGHELGPPIVVHCSAGIGRTGTFCTLDICIRRLEDVGAIDVKGTVEKIRSQRAFSIQMPDQYVFCHLALLEYALATGKMTDADLTGFEGDNSDSD